MHRFPAMNRSSGEPFGGSVGLDVARGFKRAPKIDRCWCYEGLRSATCGHSRQAAFRQASRNRGRVHMVFDRRIGLVARLGRLSAVLLTAAGSSQAQAPQEFLSWYDGWGTQTLWGIGKIESSYNNTAVQCGRLAIPVRAVYDTHADIDPPTAGQSREHAARVNLALSKALEANGSKCAFVLVKSP